MSSSFARKVVEARETRGWSQEDLARASGTSQSTIDRIERGVTRFSSAMPRIASALDIAFVMQGKKGQAEITVPLNGAWNQPQDGNEVPVFAAAEGGNGAFVIEKSPVDYVTSPAPIDGIADGYLVYIVGESMAPAYRPGERAIIHPRLPPVPDEACIFYTNDGADDRASIKMLVKITSTEWHVEQFNPPKQFTLDRKKWPKCHRVVGKFSRL